MKRLLILLGLLILGVGLYAQADSVAIGAMTEATTIAASDMFAVEQTDSTRMVTKHYLQKTLRDSLIAVEAAKEDVLTNSAGLLAAMSDETGTGLAVFSIDPTFTTQITIGSGVITATEAGYIDPTSSIQTQFDAKVNVADSSGVDAGSYATGSDLAVVAALAGQTPLDDIADPDAATSISLDDEEMITINSAHDAGTVLTINMTDGDADGNMYGIDMIHAGDANTAYRFMRCYDNTSDLQFDVASNGNVTTAGTITANSWILANYGINNRRLHDTPATSPELSFQKARDGTPTDNVSDEDYIGEINFEGYHTDEYSKGAIIQAIVDNTPGEDDMPTRLEFLTSANGSDTPTKRLTIDATGASTFTGSIESDELITSPVFNAAGSFILSDWNSTVNGIQYYGAAATFTDEGPLGTRASRNGTSFGVPTFAGDNEVTVTTGANVYIAGPPTAGSSMTITNPYALYIASGNNYFSGVNTFGTSIGIGDATLSEAELEILDGAPGTLTSTELGYVDGVTSAIQTQINAKLNTADTVDLGSVVKILTDTSTYFTVQWGAGNPGDTVGFNLDSVFVKWRWGGSHTLNITGIYTLVTGVSPDIDLAFLTNTTPVAAGATAVTTTDITTTNKADWTATTTINNPTVEPGESLMIRIDQLTQKPYSLSIAIDGYLTE